MKERKGKEGKMIRRKGKKEWRGIWNEEGRREFREKWGEVERMREQSIEEQWREMKVGLKREVKEGGKDESKVGKKVGWWDEECREEKRRVRKLLRNWRRGKGRRRNTKEGGRGIRKCASGKKWRRT